MKTDQSFILKKRCQSEIFDELEFENVDLSNICLQRKCKKQKTDENSNLSSNEDIKLSDLLNKSEDVSWTKISTLFNKNAPECMNRRLTHTNINNQKKGTWSDFEDNMLLKWCQEHGPNFWTDCSKVIKGRSGKQCRERWINAQDPKIKKGNWSTDEQDRIFNNLFKYGSSWSTISRDIFGRTENSIKNYFYSAIRRIQSSKAFEYIRLAKFGCKALEFEDNDEFREYYEFEKQNHLAIRIVQYMRKINLWKAEHPNLELEQEEKNFIEFLIKVTVDDKKQLKVSKQLNFKNILEYGKCSETNSTNNSPIFNFKETTHKSYHNQEIEDKNILKPSNKLNNGFNFVQNNAHNSLFKPVDFNKKANNESFIKNYGSIWPQSKNEKLQKPNLKQNGYNQIDTNNKKLTGNHQDSPVIQKINPENQFDQPSLVLLSNNLKNLNDLNPDQLKALLDHGSINKNTFAADDIQEKTFSDFREFVDIDNIKLLNGMLGQIYKFGSGLEFEQPINSCLIEPICLNCSKCNLKNDCYKENETPEAEKLDLVQDQEIVNSCKGIGI